MVLLPPTNTINNLSSNLNYTSGRRLLDKKSNRDVSSKLIITNDNPTFNIGFLDQNL